MNKEAKAFQRLMADLSLAISSPDAIAFAVYAAAIIDSEKRDEIIDYELSSKKKRALLTAVESQIKLRPDVYYQFLEILSRDMAMDSICQKMRNECGVGPSQQTTCIPNIKTSLTQSHDNTPSTSDPLRDPPTLLDFLENVATEIPAKWRAFGIALNISSERLDGFDDQYRGNQERCYEAIFQVWRNQSEPLRWESLLKALRTHLVDERSLAEKLSQRLITAEQ